MILHTNFYIVLTYSTKYLQILSISSNISKSSGISRDFTTKISLCNFYIFSANT